MAYGDQTDPILVTQGDTLPQIQTILWQGAAKTPVSLTGATVVFNMRKSTNPFTVIVNRQSAQIVDAANGVVQYTFTSAQTSTVDTYQGEFEVTFANGGILTFPPGAKYIWIRIDDDIA